MEDGALGIGPLHCILEQRLNAQYTYIYNGILWLLCFTCTPGFCSVCVCVCVCIYIYICVYIYIYIYFSAYWGGVGLEMKLQSRYLFTKPLDQVELAHNKKMRVSLPRTQRRARSRIIIRFLHLTLSYCFEHEAHRLEGLMLAWSFAYKASGLEPVPGDVAFQRLCELCLAVEGRLSLNALVGMINGWEVDLQDSQRTTPSVYSLLIPE